MASGKIRFVTSTRGFIATILSYGKAWISWTRPDGLPDGAQSSAGRASGGIVVQHRKQGEATRGRRKRDCLRFAEASSPTGGVYLRLRGRHKNVGGCAARFGWCDPRREAGYC